MPNGKNLNNKIFFIFFILFLAVPINAANTDDEIIKDLDFFQNIDIVKDDNPFIATTVLNESPMEKK